MPTSPRPTRRLVDHRYRRSPVTRRVLVGLLASLLAITLLPHQAMASAAGTPAPATSAEPTESTSPQLEATTGEPESEKISVLTGSPSAGQGTASGGDADTIPADVDPAVAEAVKADGSAAVIVRLAEQADITDLEQRATGAAAAAAKDARANARRAGEDQAAADRVARRAAHGARAKEVVDGLAEVADRGRRQVADLLAASGQRGQLRDVTPFWIFNGFAATVTEEGLAALTDHPAVASVQLDTVLTLPEPIATAPPKLPTWSLEKVRAPKVWGDYGVRGEGVVVGIMDSGVDGGHPALAGAYRGRDGDDSHSWFAATGEPYGSPGDGHGHGTHVMGSILGGPPGEVVGVAPGAEWVAVKIFRDSGSTSASIIHAGFQWMMAPGGDPTKAPDVVNNSWGSNDGTSREFWDDVAAWRAAGIVPMFANGNNGPGSGSVGSPGSFPHSIGVGATDDRDVIASFSSRGPAMWDGTRHLKPQISAPGVAIRSAWPQHLPQGPYYTISGTSMATPHATGVVALMLSASPGLTVDQVQQTLESTARRETHMGEVPNDTYGHGIVDAFAATTRARYAGTVSGTVTGPDGPVAATLRVVDDGGLPALTTADAGTGAYELAAREGQRELEVAAFGYVTQRRAVNVVAGEVQHLDITLERAPQATLSGTVSAADAPVDGASVTIEGLDGEPLFTDSAGEFSVVLPEGDYSILVRAAGFRTHTRTVTLAGDTRVAITLTRLTQESAAGWRQHLDNPARTGFAGEQLAAPTLQRAWSTSVGGEVLFGSPVLADGRVFVTTTDGRLHARSADDGRALWTYRAGGNLRSTPTVVDGTVYLGGGDDNRLHAIDAATGALRWRYDTGSERTTYATPAVVGDTVYLTTGWGTGNGGTVHAINAADGTVRWKRNVGAQTFFGPTIGAGLLLAPSGDERRLTALDPQTGDVVWTYTRPGTDTFVGAVSVADGVAYAATTDFDRNTGSLLAIDAASGALLWEADHGDAQGNTPVVFGDLVIAGTHTTGLLAAYDRATGKRVWQVSAGPAVTVSTAASADGFVLAGVQLDNEILAVDAATGRLAWRDTLTDSVLSTPAYGDGLLVAADKSGGLVAYTPTGAVNGTVSGPDGPLAATVRISETGTTVRSDPETGAFTLRHRPGSWTLEIAEYGYERHSAPITISAGRTTTVDADLRSAGRGTISGVVRDEAGNPVPGAEVTLAATPVTPVASDASGAFVFGDVAAGVWTLEVAAPGFVPFTQSVEVLADTTTSVEITLQRYDVAVVGDYEGQIRDVLERNGLRAEEVGYADVAARAGDWGVVVVNGGGSATDPGRTLLLEVLASTKAAGTSVVWLDSWGRYWGGVDHLQLHTGDPAATVYDDGDGRVSFVAHGEHPLTAALGALDERVEVARSNGYWSAFEGWSGRTLADVHTDGRGTVGGAIGLRLRGYDSADVLLSTLGVSPLSETEDWRGPADRILLDAVRWAADARFGAIAGRVTAAEDGTPLPALVTVVETGEQIRSEPDGSYRLLIEQGTWTLRVTHVGRTPVEVAVTVEAGAESSADVALTASGLGALAGTVTSGRDGAPLAGATVTVVGAGGSGEDVTAVTEPDGSFAIDLPAGTYERRVSAAGHRSDVATVTVLRGAVTTDDVELEPSARVGMVADYAGQLTAVLQAAEFEVEPISLTDTARLGDFDVVLVNDPDPDPARTTFLNFLAALDESATSAIFMDDYWSFVGAVRFLRSYVGDPGPRVTISGQGEIRYVPIDPSHPLFEGLEGEPVILGAGRRGVAIGDYSGYPLARVASETQGDRGVGAAFSPRTPTSVHVLLGGLAASVFQDPFDDWTDEARTILVNAVRFAAAPGLGTVRGTVRGVDEQPVAATVEVVGTARQATADAGGAYVLPLPAGEHTLRIGAFGYQPVERTVTVSRNGTTVLDVNLEPAAHGRITGTVTALPPVGTGVGSPAPQAEGSPLPGATVALLGTPRTATTDDQGRFALELVEPGEYELEVVAENHVRTRLDVVVTEGATTSAQVAVLPAPSVGVIDDYDGRLAAYLEWWGYRPQALDWTDTGLVGEVDLVVANLASYPRRDPGADGFREFRDAADRAGVSVLWLDQFGRGSIPVLQTHEGDPQSRYEARTGGAVTLTVDPTHAEHPIVAGLPASFQLVADNREYSWFDGYSGTVIASVDSATKGGGPMVAVRGRTAGAVDVLLGTLSVSTYGYPAYGDVAARNWTPYAERLLRNAIAYTVQPPALAAEARVTVRSATGEPLGATVQVKETGRAYPTRPSDGTVVIPLQPGTWTLQASAFAHVSSEREVTVGAGQVVTAVITLDRDRVGTIAGRVTDPDGLPIPNTLINVLGTPVSGQTDGDGRFTITDLPQGSYTLRFRAVGYRVEERLVDVVPDQTARVDVELVPAAAVAVVADSLGSLAGLLESRGYATSSFSTAQFDLVADQIGDYGLVIINAGGALSQRPALERLLADAASAGVSVIATGQWAGGAIGTLSQMRADPADYAYGSVPETVTVTAASPHPITEGLPVGEPVPLLVNPGFNQQWMTWSGYSGTTVAHLGNAAGADLGEAFGYRFTSGSSVEILLGGLQAGSYGRPGYRWTDAAERVFLNAVAWASEASQGGVLGTVTAGGEPVAGARVMAVEAGISTTTASDGRYRLDLPDGSYTVRVEALGYDTAEQPVTISDSAVVTLDFALVAQPRGTLTGTIRSSAGWSIAGATVIVDGPVSVTVTTDGDGAYVADGLLEGDYTVSVAAPDHLSASATARVEQRQTTTLDVTLTVVDVAVLGDAGTTLSDWLVSQGIAASSIGWDAVDSLASYDVVVVNGGRPDEAAFDKLIASAEEHQISLVWLGTWGVADGGVRILERYGDGTVSVGGQGYGAGSVRLTDFAEHPILAGLPDPAAAVADDGYHSWLDGYVGHHLARLEVGDGDLGHGGIAVGYDWRTAGGVDVVLSVGAVTGLSGPGYGWSADTGRLIKSAVTWARDAMLEPPAAPTLVAETLLTATDTVAVSGTAGYREQVRVLRDGAEVVASAQVNRDGTWSATVPLVEGRNLLTAVAENPAGASAESVAVTVVRDSTGPVLTWTPEDRTGTVADSVVVAGTATDGHGVELALDGAPVPLGRDGSFEVEVPLEIGERVLELVATDSLGNRTVERRTVARLDLAPAWLIAGTGPGPRTTPVLFALLRPDGSPVRFDGDTVTLSALQPAGSMAGEWPMRWEDDSQRYLALVKELTSGSYDLRASGVIDGWFVAVDGPRLEVK